MSAAPDQIDGVGQIAIRVRDLDTARGFYRDVLGLRHLFDAPPRMAFFECGGVRLMVAEEEPDAAEPVPSVVYFTVGDIQAAARAIEGRGGVIERAPHLVAKLGHADLWLAFLRDADRNLLALMSEVPHAAAAAR
jgi:methylmalonyl-CoA/ethylmalonyl-CoA epimerase